MLFMIFSIGMMFFLIYIYAIHMIFSNYRDGSAQKCDFFNIEDGILNRILSALRDDAEEFLWDERQPW